MILVHRIVIFNLPNQLDQYPNHMMNVSHMFN